MTVKRAIAVVLFALGGLVCPAATPGQTPAEPAPQVQPTQPTQQTEQGSGSISGRVMKGDQPAAGITILVTLSAKDEENMLQAITRGFPSTKGITDSDGRYHVVGLAAGSYDVAISAPAFVFTGSESEHITLGDGEAVENIDFHVLDGGVITGKVTGADGRPAIGCNISLVPVRDPGTQPEQPMGKAQVRGFDMSQQSNAETDDRGVYRAFGIAPGKYKISVTAGSSIADLMGRGQRAQPTFYPAAPKAEQAAVVEVGAGAEVTGIDIKIPPAARGYKVTGRVVDDSGSPVAGAVISVGPAAGGETQTFFGSGIGGASSADGTFRLEHLTTGRYQATAYFGPGSQSDYYGDAATFEVGSTDVTGVEIKAHKAGSLAGIAVIEGNPAQDTAAILPSVNLFATLAPRTEGARSGISYSVTGYSNTRIESDGSFQLKGLGPGRYLISMAAALGQKGLAISRIEMNGAVLNSSIDLGPAEQKSGIKVVLVPATCVIAGQVVVDGAKPAGTSFSIFVSPGTSQSGFPNPSQMPGALGQMRSVEASPDGKFRVENLPPGVYTVRLDASDASGSSGDSGQSQVVTVSNDAEAQVTFTYVPPQKKNPDKSN